MDALDRPVGRNEQRRAVVEVELGRPATRTSDASAACRTSSPVASSSAAECIGISARAHVGPTRTCSSRPSWSAASAAATASSWRRSKYSSAAGAAGRAPAAGPTRIRAASPVKPDFRSKLRRHAALDASAAAAAARQTTHLRREPLAARHGDAFRCRAALRERRRVHRRAAAPQIAARKTRSCSLYTLSSEHGLRPLLGRLARAALAHRPGGSVVLWRSRRCSRSCGDQGGGSKLAQQRALEAGREASLVQMENDVFSKTLDTLSAEVARLKADNARQRRAKQTDLSRSLAGRRGSAGAAAARRRGRRRRRARARGRIQARRARRRQAAADPGERRGVDRRRLRQHAEGDLLDRKRFHAAVAEIAAVPPSHRFVFDRCSSIATATRRSTSASLRAGSRCWPARARRSSKLVRVRSTPTQRLAVEGGAHAILHVAAS